MYKPYHSQAFFAAASIRLSKIPSSISLTQSRAWLSSISASLASASCLWSSLSMVFILKSEDDREMMSTKGNAHRGSQRSLNLLGFPCGVAKDDAPDPEGWGMGEADRLRETGRDAR